MNPFMMMFGPLGGFGFFGGGCGCGVNMPYYGMDDRLTFMNFPVFRNTSMDYLLDPRLSLMQSQQSWMNGGNIFGNTMLPMFNNFPGMNFPGMNTPWNIWGPQRAETDDEKKKREAKEAEDKKPEAEKAKALKNTFDKIKKFAEENKEVLSLDKSIIDKAAEAMKKEKAEDRLTAMKEVLALIPDDKLKIAIYSDDKVRKNLRVSGFNFDQNDVKNKDIKSGDADNIDKLTNLHDELQRKSYNELQIISGQLASKDTAKDLILSVISNRNDKYHGAKDLGLLRWIAANLPTGDDAIAKKDIVYACTINFIQALEAKAAEYKGCPKIEKALQDLLNAKEAMIKNFDAGKINNVANAFDVLYARLRMQEAVKVNNLIQNDNDFKFINEAKSGFINDKMVVEETYADLISEGFTNPPQVDDLDKVKKPTVVTVTSDGVEDPDKKYEGKTQQLVEEYLAKDNKYLTNIEGTEVYQTKDYDGNGSGVRYFSVQDGKLIEVTKKEDGTFEVPADAKAVTAKEIEAYDEAVQRIDKLLHTDKSIVPVENTSNLFKATGADEYYALVGNKFGKVKTSADNKKVDQLTVNDLEEFNDSDVKSTEKIEADKKEEEEKKKQEEALTEELTSDNIHSYSDINRKRLNELNLEYTGVDGWYKLSKGENVGYYKYNAQTNNFELQKDVKEVNNDGTYTDNNDHLHMCRQAGKPEYYAKQLNKALFIYTDNKEEKQALRSLHTFLSYDNSEEVAAFLKAYDDATGWYEGGLCNAIYEECGCFTDSVERDGEKYSYYKDFFIERIAEQLLVVANDTNIDQSVIDDIQTIENGDRLKWYQNNAKSLDSLIKTVLEEYDKNKEQKD